MAESSTISPDKLLCRFFAMSGCREGNLCMFSHDRSLTTWDNVCRFYLQGRCLYGSRCRYDHVKIKPTNNDSNYNKSESINHHPMPSITSAVTHSVVSETESKRTPTSKLNFVDYYRKNEKSSATGPGTLNWVNAPEFVPKAGAFSYAEKLTVGQEHLKKPKSNVGICPYYEIGDCPFGDFCSYTHGEVCDVCGKACLMPFDNEQQQKHKEICEKELVEDMELSFAIQRSVDKTCGICFDVIMEKQPLSERRFGILEKCNHVFCLTCIRKWRQVKPDPNFVENVLDPGVTRACPECRSSSDFVTPSSYWVDNEEEKKKLIDAYKENLSKKPCKYFREGRGSCPFAGACFYLHEYPDGRKAILPPPTRRRRQNHQGEIDFVEQIFLSDFFDSHGEPIWMQVDFDDLDYDLSDSDEDSEESFSFLFDES